MTEIIATNGVPAHSAGAFDVTKMAAVINIPREVFEQSLANATLTQVITAYDAWLRSRHRKSNALALIKHVRTLERMLETVLMPSMMNELFMSQMIEYMKTQVKDTTVSNYINTLYTVLEWSLKYGAQVPKTYRSIAVPKVKTKKYAVSLTQLFRILNYDINGIRTRAQHKRTLEKVRDTYVLASMLGMRYSDLKRLNKSMFAERGHVQFVQQKTKGKSDIAIDKVCYEVKTLEALLRKYDYCCPYVADISAYNKHLKELFGYIYGDKTVTCEVIDGEGKVIEQETLISKELRSHSARRAFVSICVKDFNRPQYDVMQASGHRSDSCFQGYICEQI